MIYCIVVEKERWWKLAQVISHRRDYHKKTKNYFLRSVVYSKIRVIFCIVLFFLTTNSFTGNIDSPKSPSNFHLTITIAIFHATIRTQIWRITSNLIYNLHYTSARSIWRECYFLVGCRDQVRIIENHRGKKNCLFWSTLATCTNCINNKNLLCGSKSKAGKRISVSTNIFPIANWCVFLESKGWGPLK